MKIHLDQIIDTVRKNLNSTNIILTGLEDHEKEVSSILHPPEQAALQYLSALILKKHGACLGGERGASIT